MIRILQVFSILNAGGMENYVMNLYRRMDRTQIQFDFLVHHRARGLFEDEIESMGGKVYHFSVMDDKNIPKYCAELNRFFRTHPEYKRPWPLEQCGLFLSGICQNARGSPSDLP